MIYSIKDFPNIANIKNLLLTVRYQINRSSYVCVTRLTKDEKWNNQEYIRLVSEKYPCPNLRQKLHFTDWDIDDPYLEVLNNPPVTDYIYLSCYPTARYREKVFPGDIRLGGNEFQPSSGAELVEDLFVDPILSKWRRGVHTFVKLQESGQTLKSAAKRY